jgi:glycosyltransferase involved in cell wall biosynthesis
MHVTWSLVAGGAEVYALNILRNLDPLVFRREICAIDQGGALEPEFRQFDIPYHIMHRRPGIEWSLMWRLYRLFREQRVDVVHTHHFNQIFYSAVAARLAGCRLIHTEHSVEVFDHWRRRAAYRMLTLLCDQVLAVGDDVNDFLRSKVGVSAKKLRTLFAGVEIPPSLVPRSGARRRLQLPPHAPIILIVARLYPEKNHGLLLSAFRSVLNEIPDAQLLMAGSGIQEAFIRNEISRLGIDNGVQLLGVRRDIPDLLAAADVVALTSDREGLPLIVLEAMAAGRPVVATHVGELPAVISDRMNGRLVPSGDVSALSKALVETLCDRRAATEMGSRGREMVTERFNLTSMISAHQAIYSR